MTLINQVVNKNRSLLFLQILLLSLFEYSLPKDLRFFSSYGTSATDVHYPIALIPALLLFGSFFKDLHRPTIYALSTLLFLQSPTLAAIMTLISLLFYRFVPWRRDLPLLTVGWAVVILMITLGIGLHLFPISQMPLLWMLFHITWALKMIAWTVYTRTYKETYSWHQFLDYFFNPVFYFFTNDLNVLTPKRYFESRISSTGTVVPLRPSLVLTQSLIGVGLIAIYGVSQKYYFNNLQSLGLWGAPLIGSVVSIIVAIVFHGANSAIQVSLLNASGFRLPIDMDKPWLAISPTDYWKRMHFFVREYMFDVIVKPVLIAMMRWNSQLYQIRLVLLGLLYFIFTCTQIGYQPYRQDRSLGIGFLVTLVFVTMMALPQLFQGSKSALYFEKHPWQGRAMTFTILYIGYWFIFYVRQGF